MRYSIYTSCFNIEKNSFNYWKFTIPKWMDFLSKNNDGGEICIGINKSEDNTLDLISKNFDSKYIKIIETNFSYDDYAFDGKIKNAALQACKNDLCIGLDLDEAVSMNKESWDYFGLNLLQSNLDALFIPVIDLCKSKKMAKSIGQKWYLHKRGLNRGVWNQAILQNGKININKSDTCELLNGQNLAITANICSNNSVLEIKNKNICYIIHYGYLSWESRLQQNLTWKPIWENRAGYEVNNIILEKEIFNNIDVFEHNLDI